MKRLPDTHRAPGQTNIGLWLDRGMDTRSADKDTKAKHVGVVAALGGEPPGYKAFFDRWAEALPSLRRPDGSGDTRPLKLVTEGRLVVGLGAESVLETSIALHHTFGVPFLPGSALKGVTARMAVALGGPWVREGEGFRTMFGHAGGDQGQSGVVTFHDALPFPGGWKLQPDTLTVHHPKYYATGSAPPTDWDAPNPVSFLTCTGTFRLFLTGPGAWVHTAATILRQALRDQGLGAKTAVGYGRLSVAADWLPPEQQIASIGDVAAFPSGARAVSRRLTVEISHLEAKHGPKTWEGTAKIGGKPAKLSGAFDTQGSPDPRAKPRHPLRAEIEGVGGNRYRIIKFVPEGD